MRKFEFLALSSKEFCDMIETITIEKLFLKKKEISSNLIILEVKVAFFTSYLRFDLEETEQALIVKKRLILYPSLLYSFLILAVLGLFVFLTSLIFVFQTHIAYFSAFGFWLLLTTILLLYTYNETEDILTHLFRTKVIK